MSLFHNLVPSATISTHPYHNHHIHPPSPQPKKKKNQTSTSKAIKSKNHSNKRITKSQQRPKTTLINPHPAPKATPINPQTQPPKSRNHQNQSKPLKLKLTEPSQRPTTNHCRDPRSMKNHCSPTTPSIASWPHLHT